MNNILNIVASASAEAAPSGIGALQLNIKSFLFQLITFVLVLLFLKKYAYKSLAGTLESRRQAVIDSLDKAKEAAVGLEKAEAKVGKLLAEARTEAEEISKRAKQEAAEQLAATEKQAKERAERIVSEARAQLDQDVVNARKALRKETIGLVAAATEQIAGEKLDAAKDAALIERALSGSEKSSK